MNRCRSVTAWRRLIILTAACAFFPVNLPANTFTVTSASNFGTGTLRDAITQANAGSGGDTIVFAIPGGGVQTITLTSPTTLPTITKPVTIDGWTQGGNGYTGPPLIDIDGASSGVSNGLLITAGNCTLRGLVIHHCGTNISLTTNGGNTVQGCYVGTTKDGTAASPNSGDDLLISAPNNVIGGNTSATRNVLSGSNKYGIEISGNAATGNVVKGNYIGTNAAGTSTLHNLSGGVFLNAAPGNTIGGTASGAGNLISGNDFNGGGIVISGTGANGNVIQGNIIGLNAAGNAKLGNSNGIIITDVNSTTIGGAVPGARNVISGSSGGQNDGIRISGAGATGTIIQGNFIGTDVTGTIALGNDAAGIFVFNGASNTLIGGMSVAARNVISGNGPTSQLADGVGISGATSSQNTVQGNYIGTDVTGTVALPNGNNGVNIFNSPNNTIGGPNAGNLISGNGTNGSGFPGWGVSIDGTTATGNIVQGNLIGTDYTGTVALGNQGGGVTIPNDQAAGFATGNTIGGIAASAGNVIAFNNGDGVLLGTDNDLVHNSIHDNGGLNYNRTSTDAAGTPNVISATSDSTSTTVTWSLHDLPNTSYNAQFYDPDIGHNMIMLLGDVNGIVSDASGNIAATVTNLPTATLNNHNVVLLLSRATALNPDRSRFLPVGSGATIGLPFGLSFGNNTVSPIWPPEPINANTGEYFGSQPTDLSLGGPMPLGFSRYYASLIKRDGRITGRMGDNWLHNFEMKLTQAGSAIEVATNTGRSINFTNVGGNWVLIGRADIPYQLVTSGPNFILGDPASQRLFTFNSTGKLIQIADGHGNAHTLTYTGNDLTGVSDGLGRTLTFTYNGSGQLSGVSDGTRNIIFGYTGSNLTSFTDALTFVTSYGYDISNLFNGLMTAKTEPEGNQPEVQSYTSAGKVGTQTERGTDTSALSYGANHRTTAIDPQNQTVVQTATGNGESSGFTDEANKTLTLGSDSTGRRNLVTDRLGNSTSIGYDAPSGKPASITNADGNTTSFTYASRNSSGITFYDVSAISYPDGTSESFGYDANGNMTSHLDRAGKSWSYTYNIKGEMLTATNPTSGVFTLTYDANGNLASSKDSDTGTTTYLHDAFSRLTRITHPDTSFVQIAYDANDRVTGITDERTNSYGYTYDHNGNLKVVTDPATNTTQFAYDALDRVLSVTDRLSHTASRTFNSRDDIATATDRNNNTSSFGYDSRRRQTSMVDPGGKTWTYGYDDEAMLTSFSNPLTQTSNAPKDKLGYTSAISDPLNHTASFNRDSMKRVASIVDPIARVSSLGYDARGLLTSAGRTGLPNASYRRNDLGLVDRITDLNGQNWLSSYTGQGRLSGMTDPLGHTSSFTYDSRGRLAQTNLAGGGTLVPTFDNADNLTRLLYSAGPDLQYGYDALNRLTSANNVVLSYDAEGRITNTNSSGVNFGAGYDNGGRLTSVTYNNGAFSVSYTYDSRSRLIGVGDALTSTSLAFGYDDAGRLTSMTRSNGVNGTYTYDAGGRLTRIREGSIIDIQYTLDNAGQVTSANMTVPLDPASVVGNTVNNFSYDAASQINTSGYTYDARGRLTAAPGHTFTFDGATRLTQIDTASFTFNGFSDILTRTQSGTTTHYFYNSAIGMTPIVAEKNDTTSQFVRYYVWTPGGQLLYSIDASSNAISFYHFDRVGSTLALTNVTGAVTDSYAYGPYGEALGHTGPSAQPFTYVGAFGVRNDPGASLYEMRARFYDPTSARFLSREPLGPRLADVCTLDPYLYALGNPTRYVDPDGTSEGDSAEFQKIQDDTFKRSIAQIHADLPKMPPGGMPDAFFVGVVSGNNGLVHRGPATDAELADLDKLEPHWLPWQAKTFVDTTVASGATPATSGDAAGAFHKFGLKFNEPKIYMGIGYLHREENFGYPKANGFGFGATPLPTEACPEHQLIGALAAQSAPIQSTVYFPTNARIGIDPNDSSLFQYGEFGPWLHSSDLSSPLRDPHAGANGGVLSFDALVNNAIKAFAHN